MKKGNVSFSDFYCTECGQKTYSLPRKTNQRREPGHLKAIWCPYCKKTTNNAEIRDLNINYTVEDFKLEYSLGRFVGGCRIDNKNLTECTKCDCSFNVKGKCWNSNYSFDCGHRK